MTAPPFSPKVRGMLRALSTAARAGRLTAREAEFVISIQRQASRPRWMPTPRQAAAIRRLYSALAEAEATLIDNHDTVDALTASNGRAAEFVGYRTRGNRPGVPRNPEIPLLTEQA